MLIIDSGSTKADWVYPQKEGSHFFQTEGINPLFQTTDQMVRIILDIADIQHLAENTDKIFFYGTSCSNEERVERVTAAFKQIFPTSEIFVTHDLMAAAHATCGNDEGVVGILGTGSSAGIYDGTSIRRVNRSLGYVLGDEGSGAFFGKQILTDYLYNQLDVTLQKDFQIDYPEINVDYVIDRIYRQANPNRFLASFMKFIGKHKGHEFIRNMLMEGFKKFITIHVLENSDKVRDKIHFVGSVAYFFQEELEEVLDEMGLKKGKIIQRPIDGLVNYHGN